MSLNTFVGQLSQPAVTGNQAITAPGFQPKFVFFWYNGPTANGTVADAMMGFGAAVSSSSRFASFAIAGDALATSDCARTQRETSACIVVTSRTPTALAVADFVSMDANGFTLNWTTADATARVINYLAIGGSDLTNVALGNLSITAADTNQSVTGLGFQPDFVFVPKMARINSTADSGANTDWQGMIGAAISSTKRAVTAILHRDNQANAQNQVLQSASLAVEYIGSNTIQNNIADFVSMDAGGFTINQSAHTGATVIDYIALKGCSFDMGAILQPSATGTQSVTGLAFQPSAVILWSANLASSAAIQAQGRVSFGIATDATHRAAIWSGGRDAITPTIENSNLDNTKVIKMMTEQTGTAATTQAAADLSSMDVAGFTLNWTTADATAREIIWVAIGPTGSGGIQPTFLPPALRPQQQALVAQ